MEKWIVVVTLLCATTLGFAQSESQNDVAVRAVVKQFEDGLNQRDLKKIEAIVAADMVAFENGQRNDTWADFRDNHLAPEMKEPATPSKTELVRLETTEHMAWAYTKSDLTITRKNGDTVNAVLWTIYVLEKREKGWKIVVLDWSIKVSR